MMTYALYLESGPKHKKTMVHVLPSPADSAGGLLGCIAQGPTTEAALDRTPDAIREFLRFLSAHGEPVDPDEEFATTIAQKLPRAIGSPTAIQPPGSRRISRRWISVCAISI